MKFYTKQHNYYCGIYLHARCLYVCILNQAGEIGRHKNIKANPQALLDTIKPYRNNLVIGIWLTEVYSRAAGKQSNTL